LITAAKNLMNAVVLTVKASYIASTKYRNKSGNKEVGIGYSPFFTVDLMCELRPCLAHRSMEDALAREETIGSDRSTA
jgi:hypothetical protein